MILVSQYSWKETLVKLILIFLFLSTEFIAQNSGIKTNLDTGELKMTFPSIYFQHKSTDYSKMPYTVDSCFKYVSLHIKDINDFVIWRDSLETEKLTWQRIKKLKTELKKYKVTGVYIESMRKEQKISRRTIETSIDSSQINYLLSLNSVFEIAKTRLLKTPSSGSHGLWIFGTCWKCVILTPFQHGTYLSKGGREHCRMDRRIQQKSVKKN